MMCCATRGTERRHFREDLTHQLRRQRLANHRLKGTLNALDEQQRINQTRLVIAKLMQQAKKLYAVAVVGAPDPAPLEQGVVAQIDGIPVDRLTYGRALARRLDGDEVRGYLDRECKIGLMSGGGFALKNEAELKAELKHMESIWPIERTLRRQAEWEDVSFDDRFKVDFKLPREDAGRSRFLRGLFGIVRHMRTTVTDQEIVEAYEARKENKYGEHLLVTDIKIVFVQTGNTFGQRGLSHRDALKAASKVFSDVTSGVPFGRVVADIRSRRDPGFLANRIRIYKQGDREGLWKLVSSLRDGELSSPQDGLSEGAPVPTRTPRAPVARLRPSVNSCEISPPRTKARAWLEERLKDPKYVKLRWPLVHP